MKNYKLIEHTADIRIRVKACDLKGLFKNTALAMFDIMAQKKSKIKNLRQKEWRIRQELWLKKSKIEIKQKADNPEELFVNWLNELLSLSATKGLIFSSFKINTLDENNLKATVIGNNIRDYKVSTEIKAATYHELKLEKTKSSWEAEVIFDV